VGSYSSSCSGASDPNYTISYVAGSVSVGPATPAVAVTAQSGQSTGPVTIKVVVSGPPGAAVPTGSVTVSDTAHTDTCSIAAITANGSGSCSLIENASEDGQPVTASYSGDEHYAATSGTTPEAVTPATPTLTVSGPSSAVTGLITYNVAVSGPGATPTGEVTISDGTSNCTNTLSPSGLGDCSLQEGTGTYQLTAHYHGDGDYLATSSTVTEVVNATATSLAVSSGTLVYGREQLVVLSVTVTWPPGATPPTGNTAQVMAGTSTLCTTSPLVLTYIPDPVTGLPTPVDTGSCSPAPGAVPAGHYSVAAFFPGVAGSLVGSTSTPATLTIQTATTSTVLSLADSTTTYGAESGDTLTAHVDVSASSVYPTGSVSFTTGSTTLCTVALKSGSGSCTLTRTQLPIGQHVIVANYQGTTSLIPSSSAKLPLGVDRAITSLRLQLASASVVVHSEQRARFTVSVNVPAGVPYATGTVAVTTGSRKLCTIKLVHGKGACLLTPSELPPGSYLVSASYVGSGTLRGARSARHLLVVKRATV
jgi:hypothetical protein